MKIDRMVNGTAIIFLLVSILLFIKYETWILEPRVLVEIERKSAGSVLNLTKNVKRRYAGSLTYFDLNKEKQIYEGDTIFTEKYSSLEVKLITETKLKLGELTMLIIEREGNNFKIYMTGGEVNGELAENDKLLFDVDQERIEIKGEKGSEFKIQNQKAGTSTVEGTKGRIFASYKRKEFDLSKDRLKLPQSSISTTGGSVTGQANTPESNPESALAKLNATVVQTEDIKLDDVPLDLPIPYPSDQQLFLLKNASSIILVPKKKCDTDCILTLEKDGVVVGSWPFKAITTPVVKFNVKLSDIGNYKVFLKDSKTEKTEKTEKTDNPEKDITNYSFQLKVFSKDEFERALKQGLSVEVMD